MDSGSITPVDDYYFQNIRESGYEKRISELKTELADKEKQLAEARAEIESLKLSAGELNGAFNARPKCEKCKDKNRLIEQMRQTLQWYKEQVSSCNRNGDAGELARDRLAKDVGKRAEAALAAERGE